MTTLMKQIQSIDQLQEIIEHSKTAPQLIFKFSATCVVSPTAYKQLTKFMQKRSIPVYLIIVQNARHISHAVEQHLGVRHESPQLLLLSKGRAVWQATHYKIKVRSIEKAIKLYA